MKNYSTALTAQLLVSQRVRLGESRHKMKGKKIDVITSLGTARNHQNALKCAADWLVNTKGKHLKNMDIFDVSEYLSLRAISVGQSAVNLARQSINFHLLHDDPVPFIPSQVETKLSNRAYSEGQIGLLLEAANPDMGLSICVARSGGLRAMELITIAPPVLLQESIREGWRPERFVGRETDRCFVVHGKGGLKREVRLSPPVATALLKVARPEPIIVTSRGIRYRSFFKLTAGVNFSAQFSTLSKRILGFSYGGHGLRHSFAKVRLFDLMRLGLNYADSLGVLSNELGHFSTANTTAYLRD